MLILAQRASATFFISLLLSFLLLNISTRSCSGSAVHRPNLLTITRAMLSPVPRTPAFSTEIVGLLLLKPCHEDFRLDSLVPGNLQELDHGGPLGFEQVFLKLQPLNLGIIWQASKHSSQEFIINMKHLLPFDSFQPQHYIVHISR